MAGVYVDVLAFAKEENVIRLRLSANYYHADGVSALPATVHLSWSLEHCDAHPVRVMFREWAVFKITSIS